MPSFFKIFHTCISRLVIGSIVLCSFPFLAIVWALPRTTRFKSRIVFSLVHLFYRLITWGTFLPISYKGLHNLPAKPAIFVANHQSSLDIPLLALILKAEPHIWLARNELMETFIIRFIIPLFTIVADVTNARAAAVSLRKILNMLKKTDASLLIFPEGSRFNDGKIHDFYDGFTLIAKKTARPVIPVHIDNLYRAYPRNSWFITSVPVTVTIGPAFTINEKETASDFKNRVHTWFLEQKNHPTP